MRKFIVEHSKRGTCIVEVEVVKLLLLEDPSLAWRLRPGEAVYKILMPKIPVETQFIMSWSVLDTETQALDFAIAEITMLYRRQAEKANKAFDEKECNEKLISIETRKLGANK